MNTTIFSAVLSASLLLVNTNVSWAAPASSAKVAELTAHRIDRLVSLGKIDGNFLTKLEKVEIKISNQDPVAFTARASQSQPENGSQPMQLHLSFDKEGKVLAYQVVVGGSAGPDPQWPDKDAATLTENTLHYVLDNAADPKVKMFFDGLTTFTLTKGQLNGSTVARGQVHSSLTAEKLNIYVKLDGTFISAEIIP